MKSGLKKTLLTSLAVVSAVVAFGAPAQALTIDLNMRTKESTGRSYSQDGFTLTASSRQNTSGYINLLMNPYPGWNANGSNATLALNIPGWTILTRSISELENTPKPFSFQGISVADVRNNPYGGDIEFLFRHINGTSSTQTVHLKEIEGLQAFSFNEKNLSSVEFRPRRVYSGSIQFDFIRVVEGASAVPEPASWAMMFVGFGLIGGVTRHRRRAFSRAVA